MIHPAHNVVVPTAHGMMMINRHELDFDFGVGKMLAEYGVYEPQEVQILTSIIGFLPKQCVLLDIGANIGVHTLEFARACKDKGGLVHAFEAQRMIYYMLAGNVAMNSHYNVNCHFVAMGESNGSLALPLVDYSKPTSFGSIELGTQSQHEHIGQQMRWSEQSEKVTMITLDSMQLARVDLIKMDVEGMESGVINGAKETLSRCKPVICLEFIKSDQELLQKQLTQLGYDVYLMNHMNYLCVHRDNRVVTLNGMQLLAQNTLDVAQNEAKSAENTDYEEKNIEKSSEMQAKGPNNEPQKANATKEVLTAKNTKNKAKKG